MPTEHFRCSHSLQNLSWGHFFTVNERFRRVSAVNPTAVFERHHCHAEVALLGAGLTNTSIGTNILRLLEPWYIPRLRCTFINKKKASAKTEGPGEATAHRWARLYGMTRPLHLTAIYTLGEQTRKKASRGRPFTTHTHLLSRSFPLSLSPRANFSSADMKKHWNSVFTVTQQLQHQRRQKTDENKEVFSTAGRFDSFDLSLRFGKDQSIIYELVNRLQGRKPPSEAICEERMRLYKRKSDRIVSAAGIYSFTPHNMHYEFTVKWDSYVSVTVEIVYIQSTVWTLPINLCSCMTWYLTWYTQLWELGCKKVVFWWQLRLIGMFSF